MRDTPAQLPQPFRFFSRLSELLVDGALGGPKRFKLSWIINLQKGGTLFFVAGLMFYFDHWSPAAWTYLALHGSYGLCWLLKDLSFPDPHWQRRVTLLGLVNAFLFVLGPYWCIPLILISGAFSVEAAVISPAWLALCSSIHTLGVALMLTADAQKYFTLRLQRGLISDGLFKHIRHPNYSGEIMIYGAYALLVGHWIPWLILSFVWVLVFATNIVAKERSLARHPGWLEYRARTGYLFPRLFPRLSPRRARSVEQESADSAGEPEA